MMVVVKQQLTSDAFNSYFLALLPIKILSQYLLISVVLRKLQNLDKSKSPGPDEWFQQLLQ